MSRKVLGRGLEALIPQSVTTSMAGAGGATDADVARSGVQKVALDQIDANPNQPRRHFDRERLQELSQSIGKDGILQPVVVRRKGERYQLIMGERRFQAARLAGVDEIPIMVKEDVRDADALRLALVENIQREDLNAIEVGQAYRQLVAEFGLSQGDLASMVGKDRSSVANSIRLLNLPEEVQQMVAEGKISGGHARALLVLPTQKEQLSFARRIIENGMSVRDAEKLTGLVRDKSAPRNAAAKPEKPAYLADLEQTFSSRLGTRVTIDEKRGGKGRISIEFYSHDEFERLAEAIGIPLPR